jgi:excisionase family DNA binding protein
MDNRVTSEEAANQLATAIQLLLEWARQEMIALPYLWSGKLISDRERQGDQALPDPKRLLKATEVAELLQVSRAHAYNLMRRGEIPSVRMGGAVRVRRSDLDEFIEQSKGI